MHTLKKFIPYYSPYKAELEEKIGKVAFKSMELEFKAMDEKLDKIFGV